MLTNSVGIDHYFSVGSFPLFKDCSNGIYCELTKNDDNKWGTNKKNGTVKALWLFWLTIDREALKKQVSFAHEWFQLSIERVSHRNLVNGLANQ